MSTQFKTISDVISALGNFKEEATFSSNIYLQKIKVKFHFEIQGSEVGQTDQNVAWNSQDFNNLDLTLTNPQTGCCGGTCATVGDLIKKLTQFKNNYPDEKAYSITYGKKLLGEDILQIKPSFVVNSTIWSNTTLVESFKASQITDHLNKLIEYINWQQNPTIFDIAQRFIVSYPLPTPKDYSIYLIPNSETNKDEVGLKGFHSIESAKNYLKLSGKAEVTVGSTTVCILNAPNLFTPYSESTPNVFFYRQSLIASIIKDDVNRIEEKLATIDI